MLRLTICVALLFSAIDGKPQQNTQLINDRIQNVFGSPGGRPQSINRGGFGEIVLPEPEDNLAPTQAPTVIGNGGQSCTCVPYWKCAPENNPSTTTTDSRFFGEIDVRSV